MAIHWFHPPVNVEAAAKEEGAQPICRRTQAIGLQKWRVEQPLSPSKPLAVAQEAAGRAIVRQGPGSDDASHTLRNRALRLALESYMAGMAGD
ncbi:hypothetical protein [Mesorhizobium sp.]|uniref:hypothetical protein n=1 Tax=Mesorhizobium sp. TaxID=1871066 RepID=UPI000FEA09BC|nr:hypothetical protein [Mesorhizobium sp.]RWQ47574.1 MAG: hypothetical protein EOS84_28140 [Mesorhizobium sp.]